MRAWSSTGFALMLASSGDGWDGALGQLEAGPEVHVDDNGCDLGSGLFAEVLAERVVLGLEAGLIVGAAMGYYFVTVLRPLFVLTPNY